MQPDREKEMQPANDETREVLLTDVDTSDLDERLLDIETEDESEEEDSD